MQKQVIDEKYINSLLTNMKSPTKKEAMAVINKARRKKGLALQDVAVLINIDGRGEVTSPLQNELFKAAAKVKNDIYGERVVFFAPLYTSDYCVNDCQYCNFHITNRISRRKRLSLNEVAEQVRFLIGMGHKRILLESGEDSTKNNIDYIISVIKKIYSVKTKKGNIRRINVNIAATTEENYRKLKSAHIGTYQLFQETYHRKTYEDLHKGPKQDYNRQITAHLRAFKAGIDDLGIGVLFGLYDWRFEALALIAHAQYMEKVLGVGPHTISVPRFRPAPTVTYKPQYPVSDKDFLKLITILRLAVPYTGLILSTRETPVIRRQAFKIGISQASAASVTAVGGYGVLKNQRQFFVADERPLKAVIDSIIKDKLLPSFCTACYRSGRTGERFMDITKPGNIHNYCRPNGLLTFAEYLEDFAVSGALYKKGYALIRHYLDKITDRDLRKKTEDRLINIKQGKRDLYF